MKLVTCPSGHQNRGMRSRCKEKLEVEGGGGRWGRWAKTGNDVV